MAELVVCDGSLPYRGTQLSLLTRQLISGYYAIFSQSIRKQIENPLYRCAGKTNLVFTIVECVWHLQDKYGQSLTDPANHYLMNHLQVKVKVKKIKRFDLIQI